MRPFDAIILIMFLFLFLSKKENNACMRIKNANCPTNKQWKYRHIFNGDRKDSPNSSKTLKHSEYQQRIHGDRKDGGNDRPTAKKPKEYTKLGYSSGDKMSPVSYFAAS